MERNQEKSVQEELTVSDKMEVRSSKHTELVVNLLADVKHTEAEDNNIDTTRLDAKHIEASQSDSTHDCDNNVETSQTEAKHIEAKHVEESNPVKETESDDADDEDSEDNEHAIIVSDYFDHLNDVGISYTDHFCFSLKLGACMFVGCVASIIHAIYPDVLVTSTTDTMNYIQKELNKRKLLTELQKKIQRELHKIKRN